ncbi:MAG: DUF6602 domain-containing protein [Bacteroidia bacterium]
MKKSTIIKDYSTALIKGFYERVISTKELRHKLNKGEIRELFLNELLSNFITEQFGIGTGIIVDSYGNQSHQIDVILYDNRILPPMIKNSNLGVYPLESVLAVIEVKSSISRQIILDTEKNFKHLDETLICHNQLRHPIFIVKGIIGFNRNPIKELKDGNNKNWLEKNIHHTDSICHVQKYSWIRWLSGANPWKYCKNNSSTFEETKRFVAWILDIARSKSNKRLTLFGENYIPWLSSYIRNQEEVK